MTDTSAMSFDDWAVGRDLRRPPRPTTFEALQSCRQNVLETELDLYHAKAACRMCDTGTVQLQLARNKVARLKADIAHWANYVAYYEKELANGEPVSPETGAR